MVQVKVIENKETGICEIIFTTDEGTYTMWSDKVDVVNKITEFMKKKEF